jgi:hypothetical protein
VSILDLLDEPRLAVVAVHDEDAVGRQVIFTLASAGREEERLEPQVS